MDLIVAEVEADPSDLFTEPQIQTIGREALQNGAESITSGAVLTVAVLSAIFKWVL